METRKRSKHFMPSNVVINGHGGGDTEQLQTHPVIPGTLSRLQRGDPHLEFLYQRRTKIIRESSKSTLIKKEEFLLASKTGKCSLGPKPVPIISQPTLLSDSEPELPQATPQRRPVAVAYNPMFKSGTFGENGMAVITPLDRTNTSKNRPRLSFSPATPSTVQKAINSELTSPILVSQAKLKPLSTCHSALKPRSLLYSGASSLQTSCRSIPINPEASEHTKKVHFAPNSVVYFYETSSH